MRADGRYCEPRPRGGYGQMSEHRLLVRQRSVPAGASPKISLSSISAAIDAILNKGYVFTHQPDLTAVTVTDDELRHLLAYEEVEVHPDVQLRPHSPGGAGAPAGHPKGLIDVLNHIKAPQAWNTARGSDTYIAIVDTGICGTMPEFPAWKQADGRAFDFSDPWVDENGHGSMVASIAAGTDANGGMSNGVAPDAFLYSCKTNYRTSDLIGIYAWLMGKKADHGKPIIANNSFGWFTCLPPPDDDGLTIMPDHPFAETIRDAVKAGITVVFSAGNNHQLCNPPPNSCGPNSIWVFN